jgi:FKBP-type peptidyl-prolyl cis-trans isomerase
MKYNNATDNVSENRYAAGDVYSQSDLDSRINAALVERFGAGITYDEVLEADSLQTANTAKVWYVGRFLDGFIFDTNIDEVEEIIYGKVDSEGEALSFTTADPEDNSYILAWNYSIPTLRLGQWATILTVSTYAYGLEGKTGATTSTTTNSNQAYYDYANYYNYMNYMNSYYGYGYGNMYNNGYYGYNPYYYGYVPPVSEDTSVTVTTTSTEIQAFTPLLFQVFVEK